LLKKSFTDAVPLFDGSGNSFLFGMIKRTNTCTSLYELATGAYTNRLLLLLTAAAGQGRLHQRCCCWLQQLQPAAAASSSSAGSGARGTPAGNVVN